MNHAPASIEPKDPNPDDAPVATWADCRALAMVVGVREAARRLGLNEDSACARSSREGWLKSQAAKKAVQVARGSRMKPGPRGSKQLQATNGNSVSHALQAELATLSGRSKLASLRTATATLENAARRAKKRPREVLAEAHEVKAMTATAAQAAGWDKQGSIARMSLDVAGAATLTLQIGGSEQRVEIASFAEISGLSESDGKPVVETEAEIIQ